MNSFRSQIFGGERCEGKALLGNKKPKGANAESGLQSVAVPRLETRTSDTRDTDRHRLSDEAVSVTHDAKAHDVELINLSGGGAMIRGSFAPLLWDTVQLHLGENGTIECVVRWIKGDRIGLEFAHETHIECTPEERAELLRAVLARSFPDVRLEVATPEPPETAAQPPEPDQEARRGESRHPLIWSGLVHFNHESSPVRLRNISSEGALIETSTTLPQGAELLLDLGDAGSLFATVSWAIGDQAGLRFQNRFNLAQLASARPDLAPLKWNRPAYLEGAIADTAPSNPWRHASLTELKNELEGFLKH